MKNLIEYKKESTILCMPESEEENIGNIGFGICLSTGVFLMP